MLCLLLLYFLFGSDRPAGLLSFVPALLLSILALHFLHSSSVFLILFHSCCSHAQVFGKTLEHDFPMSYNHTEWYFLFSLFGARGYKHAQRTLLQALFLKWPLKPLILKKIKLISDSRNQFRDIISDSRYLISSIAHRFQILSAFTKLKTQVYDSVQLQETWNSCTSTSSQTFAHGNSKKEIT